MFEEKNVFGLILVLYKREIEREMGMRCRERREESTSILIDPSLSLL
jgi:hypothetical protein